MSKTKPKVYKVTLASKHADSISRFVLHFSRKYTEGGMNKFEQETDYVLEPINSGKTNSLLTNSKGLPWGTYTYQIGNKVERANPDSEDHIDLVEFFEAVIKSRKTRLMRGDIRIIVTPDLKAALAEVKENNPGILDDRNFVNDKVLKQLDLDISTSVDLAIPDEEVKGMADIEKKVEEANTKAKESISVEVK